MPAPPAAPPAWHTLSADAALRELDSAPEGLDEAEAARRLAEAGPNRLAPPRRRGPLLRFVLQFHNVLIYVMLVSAGITAALGHAVDTGVLLAAILMNALIGFIQEGKAEQALEAIRDMLAPRAVVRREAHRREAHRREAHRREIDAAGLVPGDVVVIASGDRVPADLRLIACHELRVDEAALSGESLPVEKDTAAVAADAPLGDRGGMAYSGTLVVFGQATGLVVATGARTEIGRINRLLAEVGESSTPLQRQIDAFARVLAVVIVALAAATFAVGVLWRGQDPAGMFMMVVALAASAIPEGLPALMTVTLALGVQRMARRQAVVRRLPAVETLGSVSTICSDKTGTLTKNEMTVQRLVTASAVYDVGGAGYEPVGDFTAGGRVVDPTEHPALTLALRAGVLCNDAKLFEDGGAWAVVGDPTEGALLAAGHKAGFTQAMARELWPRHDAIPFESQRRCMATAHIDDQGRPWIFLKGAPERVLAACEFERADAGDRALAPDHWRRAANDIAARGLRLLALACRTAAPAGGTLAESDIERGFTLLALAGIADPPRPEAQRAVAECRDAGIRVKMITGDHAETARAIGAALGIGVGKPALTGSEIELMDDAALRRVVNEVDVFARAAPEHKLRLVQALQANGEVVAMTGDGVNDAPALKRADIGVAMGRKGTEAAKEAAALVLADDNFATIAHAVREGRAVYDNMRKFILFMLPTNGGEALIVIAAIVFELALPLTPAQVLWINMVTEATLGLALAFEPAEPGLMRRPPRPASQRLLSGFFAWRVALVSLLMMGTALGLFLWELDAGTALETARTMALNTIVFAEMLYLLNSRHVLAPVLNRAGLLGNRWALAAIALCALLQWAYTCLPAMQSVFGSTDLSLREWAKVLGAGATVFVVAELEKLVLRHTAFGRRVARA